MDLHYGDFHALKNVNLEIEANKITAFIGPSGCGKSTLLKSINRMNDLVEGCRIDGQILLDGQDIFHDIDVNLLRKRVGMVFQKPNPFPMSIYDNIAYGPRTHGIRSKAKLDDIVEKSLRNAAIWDECKDRLKKSALGMSGGQQQRLCIARALAVNPDFIVCDEPISALDVSIQAQVINLFRRLQKQFNLTYVFISHDLGIIKYISDRIMIMYLGRVMEFYTSEGIYADPKHPYTKALLSAIPPESPFDKKERLPLTGDIPSPIGDQVGCPLAGRCPHCTDRCKKEIPKLVDTGDGHMVACFLYE